MLILTRKLDEEVKIASSRSVNNFEISIKILAVSEGQVKLGITAPQEIEIFRKEIYEKVKQVTIEASKQSTRKPADASKLKVNQIRKITDGN